MTILFWRRLKEYPQGPSNLSFMFDHYLVVILFQKCWFTRETSWFTARPCGFIPKNTTLSTLLFWIVFGCSPPFSPTIFTSYSRPHLLRSPAAGAQGRLGACLVLLGLIGDPVGQSG